MTKSTMTIAEIISKILKKLLSTREIASTIFSEKYLADQTYIRFDTIGAELNKYISEQSDENTLYTCWELADTLRVLTDRFLYPRIYYEFMYSCKLACVRLSPRSGHYKANIPQETFRQWVEVCMEINENPHIRSLFAEYDLNPEEEINELLIMSNETMEYIKRRRPNSFNDILDEIQAWFLRRYELDYAANYSLIMRGKLSSNEKPKRFMLAYYFIISACFLGAVFIAQSLLPIIKCSNNSGIYLWEYVVITLPITVLLIILFIFISDGVVTVLKMMLPRYIAAIFIGYLPFVFTKDLYFFVSALKPHSWIIISILLYILTFLFIYILVFISMQTKRILKRVTVLYLHGLIVSGILSYIINISISNFFLAEKPTLNIQAQSLSLYIPGFVIFIPLALLFAIFVQIIWEDKPITHPL